MELCFRDFWRVREIPRRKRTKTENKEGHKSPDEAEDYAGIYNSPPGLGYQPNHHDKPNDTGSERNRCNLPSARSVEISHAKERSEHQEGNAGMRFQIQCPRSDAG
jgi:hypothetical protein